MAQKVGPRTGVLIYSAGEPGGPCHVVADTPSGTLCGIELPVGRGRSTAHPLNVCPRNGGGKCNLCPACADLLRRERS